MPVSPWLGAAELHLETADVAEGRVRWSQGISLVGGVAEVFPGPHWLSRPREHGTGSDRDWSSGRTLSQVLCLPRIFTCETERCGGVTGSRWLSRPLQTAIVLFEVGGLSVKLLQSVL